jgi:hypothetical protein
MKDYMCFLIVLSSVPHSEKFSSSCNVFDILGRYLV